MQPWRWTVALGRHGLVRCSIFSGREWVRVGLVARVKAMVVARLNVWERQHVRSFSMAVRMAKLHGRPARKVRTFQ